MSNIIPLSFARAKDFINKNHRHHKAPQGHKFSIGLCDDEGELIAVAIVGRPVARMLDNGLTAEVTRLCTLGHKNSCSRLYGAAARACRAMGYNRIVTYTLASESGSSLKGAGWIAEQVAQGSLWDRPSRPRTTDNPTVQMMSKTRWSKPLQ